MKIRLVALVMTLTGLAGCAVSATDDAQKVAVVATVEGQRCQDLGVVMGSNSMGWTMGHDREGAINEAKNLAADKGANTVVLEGSTSNMAQSTVMGRAYYCAK